MSADNGVYIARFKDQYRVRHAQGLKTGLDGALCWSFITPEGMRRNFVSSRVVETFMGLISMNESNANVEAIRLSNECLEDDFCPICEYGIVRLDFSAFTWFGWCKKASQMARKEIQAIRDHDIDERDLNGEYYSYLIERLETVKSLNPKEY